ncbi:MAG: metal-dependent transcriptional regulator, partial [Planctomycetota bacterium]|nr:metal-dependent transcriptional regulator [Planctomycetota bacterium]
AATGKIAVALSVSPGTVTSMLKTLSDSHLVSYVPYEGVRLTPAGTVLALRILRRHRLIELFLVNVLGMNWDEVHDEAENLEHAVSDQLVDLIDKFLGYPNVDPHGDPIPKADGSLESPDAQSLATGEVGERFRFSRVIDQSPEFLRYLSGSGLGIGTEGEVVAVDYKLTDAGTVTITVSGEKMTLALGLAAKILVDKQMSSSA